MITGYRTRTNIETWFKKNLVIFKLKNLNLSENECEFMDLYSPDNVLFNRVVGGV